MYCTNNILQLGYLKVELPVIAYYLIAVKINWSCTNRPSISVMLDNSSGFSLISRNKVMVPEGVV